MENLYDTMKNSLMFNKFVIDDMVCVEYTCPLENEHVGLFTQHDYIIHALSGRKSWRTIHGEWMIEPGQSIYVKKGGCIVKQNFDEEFCLLLFLLPDQEIRESLKDYIEKDPSYDLHLASQFSATVLNPGLYLEAFFHSMLIYFRGSTQPPDSLIRLKVKELLINLINGENNVHLTSYLKMLTLNSRPSLTQIMETNFCYNLSLEEFAKMTHRSLSAFKRDFQNHYNMTPGRWLLARRLDYAANLLLTKSSNITEVAFDSGFEDVSHFSRAFKEKFNTTPRAFRKVRA